MLFGEGTPPEALGDYTGFLLNWVGARSRSAFAAALAELDLRPPQFAAMAVIAAHPGQTQQELVAQTGIDPSTMVATVDALAGAGLAERRAHPTDRRKREVHLTAEGLRRLTAAQQAARRVGDQTFGALTPEELDALHATLRKLAGLPAQP